MLSFPILVKHSWVDIITGRGLNSKTRGKSTVRNAIVSYLDQARLRYVVLQIFSFVDPISYQCPHLFKYFSV